VAAVIEGHDGVVAGERGHVIGEILHGPAEPVHQYEPGPVAGNLDFEPDTVIHHDAHLHMVTRMTLPRPPDSAGFAPLGT
jgi:hypothetical protein